MLNWRSLLLLLHLLSLADAERRRWKKKKNVQLLNWTNNELRPPPLSVPSPPLLLLLTFLGLKSWKREERRGSPRN